MGTSRKNSELSALASECFSKAASEQNASAAEALQRMGRSYFTQAMVLNPSLNHEHFEGRARNS